MFDPIITPTDDHLVADLARLGVLFLRTRATREATPPLAPATLLAGLAASADARVRLALIPLLLARPDYADFLPDALSRLSAAAQVVLRCYATAAVVLQAHHAMRLHALFGAQPRLHDWFSAELDAPLIGSPDEQLARLAARQRQLSGRSLNWVGTYRHGAESFLRFMEQEQGWSQPDAVARPGTPVVYSGVIYIVLHRRVNNAIDHNERATVGEARPTGSLSATVSCGLHRFPLESENARRQARQKQIACAVGLD